MAIKYACLSPTEAKRIYSEKNEAVSEIYQLQMQLLTGWLLQRSDVLQFELGAAAVRIGAKINEMYPLFLDLYLVNDFRYLTCASVQVLRSSESELQCLHTQAVSRLEQLASLRL